MSEIINQLATIEVSNEVLHQLDVGGIYQSFSKNYRKLDDLKNFRTEYEKKNRLMRWWHNDKLRDAQLDSAEVQAEFSKTIGQLMMISIMQSKKLSEQQNQLNSQQGKLKTQADGIEAHTAQLQIQSRHLEKQSSELKNQADSISTQTIELHKQQKQLKEQSVHLEKLMKDYFALQGLTEEGALKLIEIGNEVKETKNQLLQEFANHTKNFEALCHDVNTKMGALSAQVGEQIQVGAEQVRAELESVQCETREALEANEANLRAHQEALQNALNEGMGKLAQSQREVELNLQEKQDELCRGFESLSSSVTSTVASASAQVEAKIQQHSENTKVEIAGIQRETNEALSAHEASLRVHQEAARNALNQGLDRLAQSQHNTEAALQSKHAALESRFSELSVTHDQRLAVHQEKLGSIDGAVEGLFARSNDLSTAVTGAKVELEALQQCVSKNLKHLRYISAGLSVVALGLAGTVAHLMRWV